MNDHELIEKLNAGLAFDDPEGMELLESLTADGPPELRKYEVEVVHEVVRKCTMMAYSADEALDLAEKAAPDPALKNANMEEVTRTGISEDGRLADVTFEKAEGAVVSMEARLWREAVEDA